METNIFQNIILPEIDTFARDHGLMPARNMFLSMRKGENEDLTKVNHFVSTFNKFYKDRIIDVHDGNLITLELQADLEPYFTLIKYHNPHVELSRINEQAYEYRVLRLVYITAIIIVGILTSGTDYFYAVLFFAILPITILSFGPKILVRFGIII